MPQDIYIWSEIEPGWRIRATDYWTAVRGYGKRVPGEMKALISDYFVTADRRLELVLKEHFMQSLPGASVRFSPNPVNETPGKGDLYFDIRVRVLETSPVYPWYRSRKLNIQPVIEYTVALYNAAGEMVARNELLDRVDYRYRVRRLVRGMSDHRRDIEIVRHSFLISLDGEGTDKLLEAIDGMMARPEARNAEPDPARFRQVVELLFDNRRVQYPGEYSDMPPVSAIPEVVMPAALQPSAANVVSEGDSNVIRQLLALVNEGKYYALLIGVNDYADRSVTDLDEPVRDASRLRDLLVTHYIFDEENCKLLLNPTRDMIISELDRLAGLLTPRDNLLIFYAGHGLWDTQLEKGFWLPADAAAGNRANWFSNSDLRDYIGGIKSLHTLVISDACFSGGIFKTREAFTGTTLAEVELYRHPSRKAMTSGNMTMVPDRSVFVEYLVRRLGENRSFSLSSEQLFASFKMAVINNSPTNQVPRYGEIRESGDEGGDFLFIRRR